MPHIRLLIAGLCAALLSNCLSPPGKRVAHSDGITANVAGSVGAYNPEPSGNGEREVLPSFSGNFNYGLKDIPLQMGVNVPGGFYFSQADLYYNYLRGRSLRLGAGALGGVFSGGYHLVGYQLTDRTETGIGVEYLRGNLFSGRYPENIYATWLQVWHDTGPRSLIGMSLQYQLATGGPALCSQGSYTCPWDLSDHGSMTMRLSYAMRLGP
jgi:hypothetical protein